MMRQRIVLASKYALVGLGGALAAPVALAESKNLYDEKDSVAVAPVPGSVEAAHDPKPTEPGPLDTSIVNGVRVRSSEALEKNVSIARKWLADKTNKGQEQVDSAFKQYLNVEQSVTGTVAGLKAEDEDILPGGIYVLVGALTGSILSRNRNVLVRAISPLAVGIGAFYYFLPKTFNNTRALVWHFEQKSPVLAEYHTKTQAQIEELASTVDSTVNDSIKGLENGVHKTRRFIADSTGLQLPEDESDSKRK